MTKIFNGSKVEYDLVLKYQTRVPEFEDTGLRIVSPVSDDICDHHFFGVGMVVAGESIFQGETPKKSHVYYIKIYPIIL